MCGIVGLISKMQGGFYSADVNLFTQMLVADSVRGTDGTGVVGVYKTGSVGWMKVGAHPYALVNSKPYDKWCQKMTQSCDIVFGHNRKATAGSISNENAHPFVHEHIILVHNGMISNSKDFADTDVDSQAIAHAIVKKGAKEAVKSLRGAFALVWFNIKERKLYAVRNDERPLYITETKDQIAFASEGSMLRWLGDRNSRSWDKIYMLPKGHLFCYDQLKREATMEETPLHTWQQTNYSGRTNPNYADCGYSDVGDCFEGGLPQVSDESDPTDTELTEAEALALEHRTQADVKSMGLDEEEEQIVKFVKSYQIDQDVFFKPVSLSDQKVAVAEGGDYKYMKMEGVVRGHPDVHVEARFDSDMDKNYGLTATELMKNDVLKAKVRAVQYFPHEKKKVLTVAFVKVQETFKTYNHVSLTAAEWFDICRNHKCTGCASKLITKAYKGTCVVKKKERIDKVFCPSCVLNQFQKMKPADKISLIDINGVSPETFLKEKDWNLRGSSHGS